MIQPRQPAGLGAAVLRQKRVDLRGLVGFAGLFKESDRSHCGGFEPDIRLFGGFERVGQELERGVRGVIPHGAPGGTGHFVVGALRQLGDFRERRLVLDERKRVHHADLRPAGELPERVTQGGDGGFRADPLEQEARVIDRRRVHQKRSDERNFRVGADSVKFRADVLFGVGAGLFFGQHFGQTGGRGFAEFRVGRGVNHDPVHRADGFRVGPGDPGLKTGPCRFDLFRSKFSG